MFRKKKQKENEIVTEEYDNVNYNDYGMNNIDYEEVIEKEPKSRVIMNMIFIIIIALGIMIAADVIAITKYNAGPYFAIRTRTYDDGGTQVFYGLGYKVIKYNQVQGRRDTEIGFWTMPYSVEPTEISTLDLAIEFRNDPEKTANKFSGQFVRMTGTIYRIKEDELVLRYKDPDGAYTLRVNCPMAEENNFEGMEEGMEVTVLGTIETFTIATEDHPNIVRMSNCFAE